MKNNIFGKGLAVAMIVLFVGMSIIPLVGSLSVERDVSTKEQICKSNSGDDNTPPVTTISFDPLDPDGLNDWYVSDIEITLEAIDDMSGVDFIKYLLDDNDWMIYTTPLIIKSNGYHRITYYAVDKAGNVEQPSEVVRFKLDQTEPWAGCSIKTVGFNKYKFTVDANDETSGINRVEFYWGDVLQHIDYEAPYEWIIRISDIKEVATLHTIYPFYAYDNAGWFTQAIGDDSISKNIHNNLNQQTSQQSSQQINQLLYNLIMRHQTSN